MRIAQIVLPGASQYERKSQRADHAALAERHDVIVTDIDHVPDAHVAHIYATGALPAKAFVKFPMPYVSSAELRPSRWSFRRPVAPSYVVSPLGDQAVPEAVEDAYWGWSGARGDDDRGRPSRPRIVGSYDRPQNRNFVEQTLARIHRFRDDVTWHLFERVPTPEDLAGVDAWIDPAVSENDFDGFVAEALVVGLAVVASRTPINSLRLEQGRTGLLVPPGDPNEMTHAILAVLFKREVAEGRQKSAQQTVSKFRARQRLRILAHLYETLIR